ncbi:MAG: hypothetical protein ACFB0G_16080 [Leptolyngbyaceae cyanobacterium]
MLTQIPQQIERASRKLAFHARRYWSPIASPPLSAGEEQILQNLRQAGVAITSLLQLDYPQTSALLRAIDEAIVHLPDASGLLVGASDRQIEGHQTSIAKNQLLQHPDIFLWGLQDACLDLAETYFQQPIAYLGCALFQEIPNQRQSGTRLWHRDGEDYKVLKLLIYLNDVDQGGGPFEYIPRQMSPSYRPFCRHGNIITDAIMAQVIPPTHWRQCLGPRGTVIVVDTVNVFHHATVPQRPRIALTFAYTSARPKDLERCRLFFKYSDPVAWQHCQTLMSPRQRQAAQGWR